jgi:hypothetical protein
VTLVLTTSTGKKLEGPLPQLLAASRFTPGRVSCSSCAIVVINGLVCHEHGCPDAWKDEKRECKWCGQDFMPEYRLQRCCDDDCENSYRG